MADAEEQEKITKLAGTLKASGLAASTEDALETAKRIITKEQGQPEENPVEENKDEKLNSFIEKKAPSEQQQEIISVEEPEMPNFIPKEQFDSEPLPEKEEINESSDGEMLPEEEPTIQEPEKDPFDDDEESLDKEEEKSETQKTLPSVDDLEDMSERDAPDYDITKEKKPLKELMEEAKE
ncbi:MAG: hypothetical protein GY861_15810 [bacterium]|nr:hypothetical protein [bacterium]